MEKIQKNLYISSNGIVKPEYNKEIINYEMVQSNDDFSNSLHFFR